MDEDKIYYTKGMVIVKQGINGPFIGKVGSVIGYELNGQNVMRTVGRRTKPFSKLELLNQAKMRVVSSFLAPIKPFVKYGFQREAPEGSRVGAFQLAQSHVRKHAIALDGDDQPFVDPTCVLFAKGRLEPPLDCTVQREGKSGVTLRWKAPAASRHDRLLVLLYDGYMFRHFHHGGAERGSLTDFFDVPLLDCIDDPVHVYAAFENSLLDRISNSVYCGVIEPVQAALPVVESKPVSDPAPIAQHGQLDLAFPD